MADVGQVPAELTPGRLTFLWAAAAITFIEFA